ncbi:MAG: radical SAM protein [Verrucomicrobiae bacterium]|nr:radical SAM protein [Verrucomicrobiae bacterium]
MDSNANLGGVRMVIAKVTHSCNLRCAYCCADAIPLTQPGATMAIETHRNAARLLAGQTESEALHWIFHGGEPMLLPAAWYEEAIEFLIGVAEANPRLQRLVVGMQSNLTRLTPEMLALVKKYRIQVGTSLDGPPQISDLYRQAGKRVEETIELMTREGAPPGVIAQIHRNAMSNLDEVIDYFDRKGFAVMFNPTCPTGRGANVEGLTGEELFDARRRLLERADRSGNLKLLGPDLVRQLWWFASQTRDMGERTCHDYNCGGGVTLIGVDPNGDLWPCGRASDAEMSRLGNVNEPESLRNYPRALMRFHEKDAWYVRCFGCAAQLICLFGCTAFDKDSVPTRETDCHATLLLYQYLCAHPDLARRMVERFHAEMTRVREEVETGKLPPPFLKLHTGAHPCENRSVGCEPATVAGQELTVRFGADANAAIGGPNGAAAPREPVRQAGEVRRDRRTREAALTS